MVFHDPRQAQHQVCKMVKMIAPGAPPTLPQWRTPKPPAQPPPSAPAKSLRPSPPPVASCWRVQPGYDYRGNDIQTKYGVSFSQCNEACQAIRNCVAFTWANVTDSKGTANTCWLKSGLGSNVTTTSPRRTSGINTCAGE